MDLFHYRIYFIFYRDESCLEFCRQGLERWDINAFKEQQHLSKQPPKEKGGGKKPTYFTPTWRSNSSVFQRKSLFHWERVEAKQVPLTLPIMVMSFKSKTQAGLMGEGTGDVLSRFLLTTSVPNVYCNLGICDTPSQTMQSDPQLPNGQNRHVLQLSCCPLQHALSQKPVLVLEVLLQLPGPRHRADTLGVNQMLNLSPWSYTRANLHPCQPHPTLAQLEEGKISLWQTGWELQSRKNCTV